jgi:hypothetical protein
LRHRAAWLARQPKRCDHSGIGLPGCDFCSPRKQQAERIEQHNAQEQERLPEGWRREAGGDDEAHEHVSGAFVGTRHHVYGYCWCPGADDDIVDAKLWKPTREEAMATALGYKIARHGTRHEWHSAQASGFGFADAREAAMAALEYDAGQRGAG